MMTRSLSFRETEKYVTDHFFESFFSWFSNPKFFPLAHVHIRLGYNKSWDSAYKVNLPTFEKLKPLPQISCV